MYGFSEGLEVQNRMPKTNVKKLGKAENCPPPATSRYKLYVAQGASPERKLRLLIIFKNKSQKKCVDTWHRIACNLCVSFKAREPPPLRPTYERFVFHKIAYTPFMIDHSFTFRVVKT